MLFRDFCGFLESQRRFADELRRAQPGRSFGHEHEEISREAFSVERKVLRFSLQNVARHQDFAWFSDSAFADAGSMKAVWRNDARRRSIADLIWETKNDNPSLVARRILLLDRIDFAGSRQTGLIELCRDVVFLLRKGIDVAISSKAQAREIDEMFNYALVSDGLTMKASERHRTWMMASLATDHGMFPRLKHNYETLWSRVANSTLVRLEASNFINRKDWRELRSGSESIEEQRLKPVLLILEDWLAQTDSAWFTPPV